MNFEEKFKQLLTDSDNLVTGYFDDATTEFSERGFYLYSQTATLDVTFNPETQDWSVKCISDDEPDEISQDGNGWSELVDFLCYDSDLTWFMNMSKDQVEELKEGISEPTPDKDDIEDTETSKKDNIPLKEDDSDEGNPNIVNDVHDAVAYMECIDFGPLNKFISDIVGIEVKLEASNVRADRYGSSYYSDVADKRNFADQCGIMSPVYKEVYIDCFNSVLTRDKEANDGSYYYWCSPSFRFNMTSGGSNGIGIATAVYKNGEWIRMEKDWRDE